MDSKADQSDRKRQSLKPRGADDAVRKEAGKPLIGIACHTDSGGEEDLYPGMPLNYIERTYANILIKCGMIPVMVPVYKNESYIMDILSKLDGLVASGGGKIRPSLLEGGPTPPLAVTAPERYEFEKEFYRRALEMDMPIIGMCRGAQMINEILGGTMVLHIPSEIKNCLEHRQSNQNIPDEIPTHKIQIDPGSLLARLIGKEEAEVNSFHRQSVKEPGEGLVISARAPDGVVEAVESGRHSFVLLTQFHPESLCNSDKTWNRLFDEFRIQANLYANRRCKNKSI
jgi:putative glutamine amidotransferase